MEKVILIRFGELFLKGKNRGAFERKLVNNINEKLQEFSVKAVNVGSRYMVSNYVMDHENIIIEKLKTVFGIHSLSPSIMLNNNYNEILDYIKSIKISSNTFRVTVNRADKRFPLNSNKLSEVLGAEILKGNSGITVNLHNPQTEVFIDIRENNKTFIFYNIIEGERGIPLGMGGKGLLLLSGGIDSPVAGYLIAKRGMQLQALHFHSYPYTSEQAKEKVITLAKHLSEYVGPIKLHFVKFTAIQEAIHKHCRSEYMITIMRRIMLQIAEKVAKDNHINALISGESLGQVASQTIESITVTNNVVKELPVLRPLIAMDKEEITAVAKKINTFKTSILPYEDCCTVFLPKHPLIKPKLEKVENEELRILNIVELINVAMQNIETLIV